MFNNKKLNNIEHTFILKICCKSYVFLENNRESLWEPLRCVCSYLSLKTDRIKFKQCTGKGASCEFLDPQPHPRFCALINNPVMPRSVTVQHLVALFSWPVLCPADGGSSLPEALTPVCHAVYEATDHWQNSCATNGGQIQPCSLQVTIRHSVKQPRVNRPHYLANISHQDPLAYLRP